MRRAILIGNSRYDDPNISRLEFAHKDAIRLGRTLEETCGFRREDLTYLLSPADQEQASTRSNIVRALLSRPTGETDLLILFFSGHGFRSSADGKDYLLPQDAVSGKIEFSALCLDDLVALVAEHKARHTILILDACRNVVDGSKALQPNAKNFNPESFSFPGIAAFFSCAPTQRSFEIEELENGIFTYAISEALSGVGRCRTILELDSYVSTRVPELASKYLRPIQNPYTRVEPLSIAQTILVSSAQLASWTNDLEIGERLFYLPPETASAVVPPDSSGLLAVDFGSSKSLAAVMMIDKTTRYVRGSDGRRNIPSLLFLNREKDYAIGTDAAMAPIEFGSTIYKNFKRQLASHEGRIPLQPGGLTCADCAYLLLVGLKDDAERVLGRAVDRAIAAVPANFGIAGCTAIAQAFSLAGIKLERLVGEPCAAAMCLVRVADRIFAARSTKADNSARVLIVDIGGGTSDFAVVDIARVDDELQIEVLSVAGSNVIGGFDFDQIVLGLLLRVAQSYVAKAGAPFGKREIRSLELDSERIKIAFNTREVAHSVLPNLETSAGLADVEVTLNRSDFEVGSKVLITEIDRLANEAIEVVRSDPASAPIDFVMLAGQGSRIFPVRKWLEGRFSPEQIIDSFQDNAVVEGLTLQGGILAGLEKKVLLLDALYSGIAIRCKEVKRHARDFSQGQFRDMSEVDDIVVVSEESASNLQYYVMLERFTTIPTKFKLQIELESNAAVGLALELFEVQQSGKIGASIGSARPHLDAATLTLRVGCDVDANCVILFCVYADPPLLETRHSEFFGDYIHENPRQSWIANQRWTAAADRYLSKGIEYLDLG